MARKRRGPIRRLFRFIIWTIVSILFIPVLMLFLFYKDVTPPVDDYDTSNLAFTNITDMIVESVDEFLINVEDDNERTPLTVSLDKSGINQTIRQQLVDSFSYTDSDLNYVHKTEQFAIKGAWITIDEKGFTIIAGLESYLLMTYKSAITLSFTIDDDTTPGIIELKLTKLKVGKMALQWASGVADWVIKKISGDGIDDVVTNALGGIGEFNLKDRTLKIDLEETIKNLSDDPEMEPIINLLYSLIFEQKLVDLINFSNNKISTSINLDRLYDDYDINDFVVAPGDRFEDEEEIKEELFSSSIPSSNELLLGLLNNKLAIEIEDTMFNRVIDYFVREGLEDKLSNYLISMPIMDEYNFNLTTPKIEIKDGLINLLIGLEIDKEDVGTFKSIIKLSASIIKGNPLGNGFNEDDLVLAITKLNIGPETGGILLDQDDITSLLKILDSDEGLFQDGHIVVEGIYDTLSSNEVKVKEIKVVNNKLKIEFELDDLELDLTPLIDEIKDGLEDLLNDPNFADYEDEVNDLLAGLDDPEADLGDLINDLLDKMGDDQDALDVLLDNLGIDFDDFDLNDFINDYGN